MPYYDFQCRECDNTFEAKRSFDEAHLLAPCPACDSENTKKLLARVAFHSEQGTAVRSSSPLPTPKRSLPSCGSHGCACHSHS